jgi:adenylate cyclase
LSNWEHFNRFVPDAIFMRRKIAAILVAHIADYGRLVADDEEETLRRMASYRSYHDDFIAVAAAVFQCRGDAFLANSQRRRSGTLRHRYPGKPAHAEPRLSDSRQMSYRIGIGIGDVVERDGDLLGDGVNIAARLEGLAEPGGICISRAVYEQVTNKLSARFIDIGARKVKNIPEPVHAYLVATWDDGRAYRRRRYPAPASAKIGQEVAFGSRSSPPSRCALRLLLSFLQASGPTARLVDSTAA